MAGTAQQPEWFARVPPLNVDHPDGTTRPVTMSCAEVAHLTGWSLASVFELVDGKVLDPVHTRDGGVRVTLESVVRHADNG